MKKFARLDKDGIILEIIQADTLKGKLHPDTAKLFIEVPSGIEVFQAKVGNTFIEKQPTGNHQLINDQWVLRKEAIDFSNKEAARERLKNIDNATSVAALRTMVKDILLLLDLSEPQA